MGKVRSRFICFLLMGVVFLPAMDGFAESADDTTLSPYFFIENGDPSVDQFPLKRPMWWSLSTASLPMW